MNLTLTLKQVYAPLAGFALLGVAAPPPAQARQSGENARHRGSLLVQKNRPRGAVGPIHRRSRKSPVRRAEPAYRKILRAIRLAKGSVSLGNTSTGGILRAARLPLRGKHFAVLPRWRKRHTNYSTDELVTLLKHAARQVAQTYPGSRMMVGNLSLKNGGDIQWSQSHNAGRDGDIAFYFRRGRRSFVPTSLIRVSPGLRSLRPGGARFDLQRNWALVKALLTHKTIPVQWIFVAKYIKMALLKHARAHRESAGLVARADKILRQPTDSLSHDDHFHVRIYCSREDRLEGCLDRAPFWKGVQTHDRAVARRVRTLLEGLKDVETAVRLQVISQLVRLNARHAAVDVARQGLKDPSPRVRRAALGALLVWCNRDRAVVAALSGLIERPGGGVLRGDARFERPPRGQPDDVRTGRQLRLAYDVLALLAARESVPFLKRALASTRAIANDRGRPALPEPLLAASAARSVLDLRLVPALISALDHSSGAVRRVVVRSLRRLTNHSFGVAWGRRLGKHQRKLQARRWQRWWRQHRNQSREGLVRQGFRRTNRRLRNLQTRRAQWVLVSYTRRPDHLGFNAHRMLRVLSGQRGRSPIIKDYGRRYQRWRRWYNRRWRRRRQPRRRRLRRIKRTPQ